MLLKFFWRHKLFFSTEKINRHNLNSQSLQMLKFNLFVETENFWITLLNPRQIDDERERKDRQADVAASAAASSNWAVSANNILDDDPNSTCTHTAHARRHALEPLRLSVQDGWTVTLFFFFFFSASSFGKVHRCVKCSLTLATTTTFQVGTVSAWAAGSLLRVTANILTGRGAMTAKGRPKKKVNGPIFLVDAWKFRFISQWLT